MLGVVVNNCEFAVIFTVHIFYLLFRVGDDELLELDLIWEALICPSILNESFAGYSNLGCRSLSFMTSNTSFQPLLACKVSFEKSADSLMGTPL